MGVNVFKESFLPLLPKTDKDKVYWGNLKGAVPALSLAQISQELDRPIVIFTADSQTASSLERELKLFVTDDTQILLLPDWEILPYDNFSPHQDIISNRLRVLSALNNLQKGLVIVPILCALHRFAPSQYIHAHSFAMNRGQTINLERFRTQLTESGYTFVSQVMGHGEFAIRGSIIDVFPMGLETPVRIDLFDNEIDSLRYFDPETQLSLEKVDSVICLPAREFPLTKESITLFRQNWRQRFAGDPSLSPIYQDVSQGTPSQGIEYYLPLFFESTSTLFDYLPANAILVKYHTIIETCDRFWQEVNHRYDQLSHDYQRPILPPDDIFVKTNDLFGHLKQYRQIELHSQSVKNAANAYNFPCLPAPDVAIDAKAAQPLKKLETFIQSHPVKILFCAESPGRRESLLELLHRHQIAVKPYTDWQSFFASKAQLGITVAPIDEGIWFENADWMLIAESQLFGQQVMQRRRRQKVQREMDATIRNLAELNIGQPVVHIDHGIGRYQGLTHITIDNIDAEYLIIEYADKAKLYVPVSSLHLISQYSAMQTSAPLSRLGSDQWEKTKKKAVEKAYDVAAELLDIYAQRAARKGFTFTKSDEQYFQFASSFPFEETPDQAKAIEEVLQDMQSEKTMDRLVCGDVGFGKTEVALRAAFVAVQDSKQVVMLVPTTLLAQQHYETFSDRFADWPVRIEVLSRFRSKKEQDKTIQALHDGTVDIVIGTHKLLNDLVKFKNLGLVIIDEEHRFGVRQKERLKALRSEVDILTMTATPIPRTLNMAMSSLRDLSIIATPPLKRLSVKTFVREYHTVHIQEAILRELMRGGQVYYLHNDIDTIEKTAQTISEIVPQARVSIAHGQMRERDLEKVMSDFYHQRFNVLVCTTIIETGIDVPTANTIIIDRADKLGLSQLHQLRGRVGRSHHQAYAYCFTPKKELITADAIKRLDALESLEELGSGFTLATHDLEIRGAGELLGEEQSGNINDVGFTLYTELLQRAIHSLKSGKKYIDAKPLHSGAEINLQLSALIPEGYLPDVHNRLILYKRIANAKDIQSLEEIQVEMIDRFGLLPLEVKNLFKITELKLKALPIGIKKIEASEQIGKIEFEEKPNINPDKIINLIREAPKHYKLSASQQFKFMFDMSTPDVRFQVVEKILDTLNG